MRRSEPGRGGTNCLVWGTNAKATSPAVAFWSGLRGLVVDRWGCGSPAEGLGSVACSVLGAVALACGYHLAVRGDEAEWNFPLMPLLIANFAAIRWHL